MRVVNMLQSLWSCEDPVDGVVWSLRINVTVHHRQALAVFFEVRHRRENNGTGTRLTIYAVAHLVMATETRQWAVPLVFL